MEVLKTIEKRRSVRSYLTNKIEDEKITAVAQAFSFAPSARNFQKRKLIIIKNEETKKMISAAANDNQFILEAPITLVAIGIDHEVMACGQRRDTVDASIAFAYAILEASEQGLGTCWLGSYDEKKVRDILNVPENCCVVAVSPLGYEDGTAAEKPRKELSEILSYETF